MDPARDPSSRVVTAAKATKDIARMRDGAIRQHRLMLDCTTAPRLPTNIVTAAIIQNAQNQKSVAA